MSNVEKNANVEKNVNVVEMPVTDQAVTVALEMMNTALSAGQEHKQTFVASSGLDEMEASLKEATKKYMHENGFSSCPISLAGMELATSYKADEIPKLIAQRIKALCDCHKTKGSYVIVTSDLSEMAVCQRKTGKRDWMLEVQKALTTISKNTTSYFEKDGTEVRASNPVEYSIENRLKKSGKLLIHFHS